MEYKFNLNMISPRPTKTDLAWAAGFFDGEGHSRTKRYKGKLQNTTRELQVGQKTVECLERLKRIFGNIGTIGGPYRVTNPVYFWYVCKTHSVDIILNAMWSYLSTPKREQALNAGFRLGFCNKPRVGRPPRDNRTIPKCHPTRIHVAHGFCKQCYHSERYKNLHGE